VLKVEGRKKRGIGVLPLTRKKGGKKREGKG